MKAEEGSRFGGRLASPRTQLFIRGTGYSRSGNMNDFVESTFYCRFRIIKEHLEAAASVNSSTSP